MRFLFKVATVFVCSLMLIAFLAACDKDSSNVSSTDNTSKEENGVTDVVVSFGSIGGSSDGSETDNSSSVNDNSSAVSSGGSSSTQSNTNSNGDANNSNNSNDDSETGSSTESSKPGDVHEDPDSWTDPV